MPAEVKCSEDFHQKTAVTKRQGGFGRRTAEVGLVSTTTPFDGYDVGGNNVLYEQGFDGSASAGTGLPTNGLIASQFNPGVTFQLQPYNANNVAFLNGAGSSVTLQLVHPSAFTSINILWAGANGGGAQNISLHFSDGTVVGALSSSGGEDWFGAYQNTAYIVGGRVLRSPNAPPSVLSTVPRLFETDIPIDPADQ